MNDYIKLPSKKFSNVILRVVPGHFVTPTSHTNYFMDMSAIMWRQAEARAAAEALAQFYTTDTVVDTIVCLDGMDVIGAYLADELTKAGILSRNAHKTMYVIRPEHDASGHLIFRDNTSLWIRDKNVLLLFSSTSTGKSVTQAINTVTYYGGTVVGISALFSKIARIYGFPVHSLFDINDLPDYHSFESNECPLCSAGHKIDAIVNGFGFSRL